MQAVNLYDWILCDVVYSLFCLLLTRTILELDVRVLCVRQIFISTNRNKNFTFAFIATIIILLIISFYYLVTIYSLSPLNPINYIV